MLIHATSVVLNNRAVLLTGASGIGKSDVALRLIDQGAFLIADDQTGLILEDNKLYATAPLSTAGLMEVRHVGLLQVPHQSKAQVSLYVELVALTEDLDRLPEAEPVFLLDHPIQRLRLPAIAASTPAKIRAALLYPLVTDR